MAVYGLAEVLTLASRQTPAVQFAVITDSIAEPDRTSSNGIDYLILPPNLTGQRPENIPPLNDWLGAAYDNGTTLCAACAGSFWLAQTGLLEGRPATTHWALADEFREKFPGVDLRPDPLLIDDGDIITAGGAMAWTDLALRIVEREIGPNAVGRLARHLLIDPRGRTQSSYRVFHPVTDHGDEAVLALQRWMEQHLTADLSVVELARQAHLAPRSFQRRFKQATGIGSSVYVQNLRIERARQLLETTGRSVAQICWDVGYNDIPAFIRLFRSLSGVSPAGYRRRFRIV